MCKSSVEYKSERPKMQSPKIQDKFGTNQNRKQKEQRLEILELLYKTGVGSGTLE